MTQCYNHDQMIADRIAGMTWLEIATKHEVPASSDPRRATRAAALVLNSRAYLNLKPADAAKLRTRG